MSMACMDPRISFSTDFVETKNEESNYREAPVSADFEFSVRNYNMKPADEIFFKGMLVPLKDNCGNTTRKTTTLREELLADDDEYEHALPRMPKSTAAWWRERLGLKRAHILSKRGDRNDGVLMEDIIEEKKSVFVNVNEEAPVGKTIQVKWECLSFFFSLERQMCFHFFFLIVDCSSQVG